MSRLELHPEVVALPGEDDGVLGGGAAGEDRAGLAQLRPGDSEGGRAVWREGEAGQDEENSPGVAGGHSPPALSSCLYIRSGHVTSRHNIILTGKFRG